ncbi:MAG: NADH:flavin oxidoreductase [Polyangiaceae bacterium]|nr:NADH:flavin oxidoreductase [Polyangiaceae bacterium]
MFIPKERIRHPLVPMHVPTRKEAAAARLFTPLELPSGLTLADRTWIPAMVPWRATDEGFVTPDVIDWYARFAAGQPGAIVVEATGIRDVPSGPLLRIGHDRFIPGLDKLVRAVSEASGGRTRLFIQIIDFLRIRRRPDPERFFSTFLQLRDEHRARLAEVNADADVGSLDDTAVRARIARLERSQLEHVLDGRELESLDMGERERVTDVHLPHVRDLPATLPGLFAEAAARAKTAGFDGVELHYAHAYTMASFLSALNTRADGYGGSLDGRMRLPLEVYAAVRERVGARFSVGARFLCDEAFEGGSSVEDACHFAVGFARAGMDFLSLSTGGKFEDAKQPKVGDAAYPYTGKSGFECMPPALSDAVGPFARNVPKQARVRAAVRSAGFTTPVVVAGGIGEFGLAESILERGHGDVIAAARQSLCDPDWFLKLREGRGGDVRRCIYSNYCEGLDQKHRKVTCQLWDREALDEPGVSTTDNGRRRLVAPPWRR